MTWKVEFLAFQVSQMEEGLEEKRVHVKELQKQSKVSVCYTLLIVLTLNKKSV